MYVIGDFNLNVSGKFGRFKNPTCHTRDDKQNI